MKKLLLALTLLISTSASASVFNFSACDIDWRIEHDTQGEMVRLMWLDLETNRWKWSVLDETTELERGVYTVDEFMENLIARINDKLATVCVGNGGGEIPTDWSGYLSYTIENRLVFNDVSNKLIKVE